MSAFVENSVDVSVGVLADVHEPSESPDDRWLREELQRMLTIWSKLAAEFDYRLDAAPALVSLLRQGFGAREMPWWGSTMCTG